MTSRTEHICHVCKVSLSPSPSSLSSLIMWRTMCSRIAGSKSCSANAMRPFTLLLMHRCIIVILITVVSSTPHLLQYQVPNRYLLQYQVPNSYRQVDTVPGTRLVSARVPTRYPTVIDRYLLQYQPGTRCHLPIGSPLPANATTVDVMDDHHLLPFLTSHHTDIANINEKRLSSQE